MVSFGRLPVSSVALSFGDIKSGEEEFPLSFLARSIMALLRPKEPVDIAISSGDRGIALASQVSPNISTGVDP